MPFEIAKTFTQRLCFKDEQEWYDHWDKNRKPVNLPLYPDIVYKDLNWVSWGNWLGTEK